MNNFDLSDVQADGELPPEGDHVVRVVNAEIKEKPSGKFIEVKLALDGQPRHVYDLFTVQHANAQAVQIGRSRLKSLLKAANYPNPDLLKDVWDLNGLTCVAKIKHKEDEFGKKARVTSYKASSKTATKDDKLGDIPQGW